MPNAKSSIECAYSFSDLFRAAFHRNPEKKELTDLYSLPQEEKNEIVLEWATKAHWHTEERTGTDGQTYLAFWP